MPETYGNIDLPDEEPTTITRRCSEVAGCGEDIEVQVHPDGSYDGGHYFGEVTVPADGARVVGEHPEDDEWFGTVNVTEWSEYETKEFWMHSECAEPEVDPDEVDHSIA